MDVIVIEGPSRLEGTVSVSGAKNSILPIMAATILAKGMCILRNVPDVSDMHNMCKILKVLGARVTYSSEHVLQIDTSGVNRNVADYKHVSTMRASVCLLGPLLARFKKAHVSLPGGCVIGPRPIDLHLKGMKALGAQITLDHGYVIADASKSGLKGTRMYLGGAFGSSVLATGNILMAAVFASGKTTIVNGACEPEVIDLGRFLIKMGAKIEGLGSPVITVTGVKKLTGCEYEIIPDRIEAGTFLMAGAVTRGDVTVRNCSSEFLGAVFDKMGETGVQLIEKDGHVRVKSKGKLRPVSLTTGVYPGFPTDLQAQMMTLLACTQGISVVTEKIFPDRFMHVPELNRMAAQIRLEGPSAIVSGVKELSGAPVMASDLRASAALALAGLAARGKTEIQRVYHLDRGYEKLEEKLRGLGAKIRREKR